MIVLLLPGAAGTPRPASAPSTGFRSGPESLPAGSVPSLSPPAPSPQSVPPETVARELQDALRAGAWRGAVARLTPERVASLRRWVDLLVEADTSGGFLAALCPGAGAAGCRGREDPEVVTRALRALMERAPGLRSGLASRDVEIIGAVAEGEDTAHVVYRNTDRLPGARPEIRVATLVRGGGGWGVARSPEIELIREALKSLGRHPSPPP